MLNHRLALLLSAILMLGCASRSDAPQTTLPASGTEAAINKQAADTSRAAEVQLAVGLVDGTKLVGQTDQRVLPFQTPYMKSDIPVAFLVSMERDPQTKTFSATLTNGDRIQGTLAVEKLEIETIVGRISVPIEKITSITTRSLSTAITEGLAAFYPLDGNADDKSGHGRNGVLHGPALSAGRDGRANGAYSFNGANTYIQIPSTLFNAYDPGITVSAWVLAKDISARGMAVYTGTHMGETQLSVDHGKFNFLAKLVDGRWYGAVAPAISDRFVHLVGVYQRGKSLQLWINGERQSETPIPDVPLYNGQPPASAAIGGYWPEGLNYVWRGVIDDVRIYNRCLSESEIAALYASDI